jgi:hypothetical protein
MDYSAADMKHIMFSVLQNSDLFGEPPNFFEKGGVFHFSRSIGKKKKSFFSVFFSLSLRVDLLQ